MCKVIGYHENIQKSIIFPHTNNEHIDTEIKNMNNL